MEVFDTTLKSAQESLLQQVDAVRTNFVVELGAIRDTTVAAVSQQFAKEKDALDARIVESAKQMEVFDTTLKAAQASILQEVGTIQGNFVTDLKTIANDVKNGLVADISATKAQVVKVSNEEINSARSWLHENPIPNTYEEIAGQLSALQEMFEPIGDPTARLLLNVRLEQLSYLLTEIDKRLVESAELGDRFDDVERMIEECQAKSDGVVAQEPYSSKKEKFEEWLKGVEAITRTLTLLEEDVPINTEFASSLEKNGEAVDEMYRKVVSSLIKAYKLDMDAELKKKELDLYAPKYPHIFLAGSVEDGFLTKLIKEGGWLYQHAQNALEEKDLANFAEQLEKIVALRKNVYTSAILGEVEYCKHEIAKDSENKEVYKTCYKMLKRIIVKPEDTYFSASDTFEMYKQQLCNDIQKEEWKWVNVLNMERQEINGLISQDSQKVITIDQY